MRSGSFVRHICCFLAVGILPKKSKVNYGVAIMLYSMYVYFVIISKFPSTGHYVRVLVLPSPMFVCPRRMRRAFTLVELLAVAAIIVVLFALLFPAVSKIVGKAQETDAQQDLRAIHTATVQYLADHDGAFFSQFDTDGPSGAWSNLWPDKLQDYLPPRGIVSNASGRNTAFYNLKVKAMNRWIADYSPNDNLIRKNDVQTPATPTRLVAVRQPAREVMFVEGAVNQPPKKLSQSSGAFTIWAKQLVIGNFDYPDTVAHRHGGTGQDAFYVVFCDGHILRIPFKEFSNDKELRQTMFSADSAGNSIYY